MEAKGVRNMYSILVVFNKHSTARVASCWFIIYYSITSSCHFLAHSKSTLMCLFYLGWLYTLCHGEKFLIPYQCEICNFRVFLQSLDHYNAEVEMAEDEEVQAGHFDCLLMGVYFKCAKLTKTNFFIIKPTRCTNFTNLFCHETLHVSGSSSVHHQDFTHCKLSNGICHTGL